MFAESSFAGSMLSFAATLSSVILAVIAIIITLIDVAGQRSNIVDVKNSVEELKSVSAEITNMMVDYDVRNIESAALITSTLKEFEDSIKIKIESAINAFEKVEKSTNDEEVVNAASIAKEELSESLKSLTTTIQNIPQANRAEVFKRAQDSMKNYNFNFQPKKK